LIPKQKKKGDLVKLCTRYVDIKRLRTAVLGNQFQSTINNNSR